MKRILIVEDEKNIAKVIEDYFRSSGFTTCIAYDGREGLGLFETFNPDIMILDVMLPLIDGFSVCKRIRKKSNVPIIMLTARTDVEDQLQGYEAKVDDYMTKPFNPEILVAKVKVLLERIDTTNHRENKAKDDPYQSLDYNGITLQIEARIVMIDGEVIELENKQFEILHYFMKNKNIVLSREQIMNAIWGYDYVGTSRAVDAQITKLRQKLRHKAYCIKTEFAVGYKFEVK